MALGRRKASTEPAAVDPDPAETPDPAPDLPAPRRRAITAAAAIVQMDGVGWRTWKFGDQAWQAEAWRMYDIVGLLRQFANWRGAAISRCRLYVAEVDDSGEGLTETEDPDVAALAAGPLGRGPAKDEALRLLGVNLAVSGEAYIVAEARDGADDLWYVVSGGEIKGTAGTGITITRPAMFGLDDELKFRPGVDLLIRCWTPHPRRTAWADSSVRAAIPVLRKIETTMKRIFAELDSRLAGAGILLLPDGVDFPRGDDTPEGVDGLSQLLQKAMATSIADRSSAAAMVPILATVPADAVDKIKHLTFWTELSEKLQEMEDAGIRRLAVELDLPPEQLLGMGSSKFWNLQIISEDIIKTHLEPDLSRMAGTLTTGYLRAAVEMLGRDPDRFVYAFDTSPLTKRPDRTADGLTYHTAGLISDDAARRSGAFEEEDAPTPEERLRRLVESAIPSMPQLLGVPAIAQLLGVPEIGILGAIAGMAPAVSDSAPPQADEPRAIPDRPSEPPSSASLLAVANLAVLHALGRAGIRLVHHRQRDQWSTTPRHQLHTRHGVVSREQADEVLRGAWDDLPSAAADLAVDAEQLREMLHGFCVELLTRGMAYDPQLLRDLVGAAVRGRRLDGPVKAVA